MKINKKMVFIATAVAIAVLIICIVTCSAVRKPVIAFYGLDKSQVDGIEQVLPSVAAKKAKSNSFRFIVLDDSKPLGKQAKSADMLFIMNGRAASAAAARLEKKHTGFAQSALDSATSSIRGLAIKAKDGKLISVPVLSDHYEIDIDTELLHESGIKTIASWKDIEKYARAVQKKVKYPIIFPGSDGVFMTSLAGAVGEAFNGTQAYDKALETAASASGQTAAIDGVAAVKAMTDGETAPLYEGVRRLGIWYKAGLINPDSLNMTEKDVIAFMSAKQAAVIFMTLSMHRNVPHESIERYASIYIPSDFPAANRKFTAPSVCAIPLTKNKKAHAAAESLLTSDGQEKLSRATGLAPVFAHCRTSDHQADDVRFWIAATNTPLAGLGRDLTDDPAQTKAAAQAFCGIIRTTE
jgi:ABC-type glycerol-3-phosphate transport system substrate-binding protein